jgi:hypothetical protein
MGRLPNTSSIARADQDRLHEAAPYRLVHEHSREPAALPALRLSRELKTLAGWSLNRRSARHGGSLTLVHGLPVLRSVPRNQTDRSRSTRHRAAPGHLRCVLHPPGLPLRRRP